jgi:hypothetical protein
MTTTHYIAADGTVLTDDLVAELAAEAESGLASTELTREPAPWHRKEPMETRSLRAPAALWALIERQAKSHGMTTSEYARQCLAESLLTRA